MNKLLRAIEKSLQTENWYSALILALTLPDICGSMEGQLQGAQRYINWFETYLAGKYDSFLSGNDCYLLRCSFLHEGSDNIEHQGKKRIIDKFVFIPKGSHRIRIAQTNPRAPKYDRKVVLQLSVENFCKDFIDAVKNWNEVVKNDTKIQENISEILEIHENGVSIGGVWIQ